MSEKESNLSSISKITGPGSVLKQTEQARKVSLGLPTSVIDTTSVIPRSIQQAVATPKLKIPRSIKDINREYKDFNIDALVELKKKVRNLDVYREEDSDVLSDVALFPNSISVKNTPNMTNC
ncbi:hypothetical protein [Vibrio metoecus]|uniref:hypothetical protein n=1 Tax=Vibrio metoecus TaxID=1481663 RepID=UPI000510A1F1|nr:hypothetical protein [Vibrio metoecus]